MNSTDDSDSSDSEYPFQCTCMYSSDRKTFFISVYKNDILRDTNIVTNETEISNYRTKYSELSNKSNKNINIIWGNVQTYSPILGQVPLKDYDQMLDPGPKIRKKRYKKPNHLIMQRKACPHFEASHSEHSDIETKSNVLSKPELEKQNSKEVPKTINSCKILEIKPQVINKNVNTNDAVYKSQNTKADKSLVTQNDNTKKKSDSNLTVKTSKNDKTVKNNLSSPATKSNKTNIKTNNLNDKNKKANSPEFKKPADTNSVKSGMSSTKEINKVVKKIESNIINQTKKSAAKSKINNEKNNLNDGKKHNNPQIKKPADTNSVKSGTSSTTETNKVEKKIESSIVNQVENPIVTDVQLNLKKKLKKQKQKEKKLEKKREPSNSSSVSESSNNKIVNKTTKIKKNTEKSVKDKMEINEKLEILKNDKSEEETEEMNTSDDNLDLLTDTENMPTFTAELVKRKGKNSEKRKAKHSTEHVFKHSEEEVGDKTDDEFIIYSRKRDKTAHAVDKSFNASEKYAVEALDMISKNNLTGGFKYLTKALSFNLNDHRHYLNRCYCYLKINKNKLALEDAQHVIQKSSNKAHLFIANLRAGQALFALQNYHQAEMYFKEAAYLNPGDYHVQRELMRVKIAHIVSMGYAEKDVLLALEKVSSKVEAIKYLMENESTLQDDTFKNINSQIDYDNCDDIIYSSDEDEKPNNIEILNQILNYHPKIVKPYHVVTKLTSTRLLASNASNNNGIMQTSLDVKKKINNKVGTTTYTGPTKEKAIWVGNLTSSITVDMLKQHFNRFCKVVSIYRPVNEAYAFINFEKTSDADKILANTSSHEIVGVKLAVRFALRQKS